MADNHKQAAGLQYAPGSNSAPKIIAKGRRCVADEILKLARENNIPIYEDSAVVELLLSLELNSEIPEDLYTIVAEILSFVYRLDDTAQSGVQKVKKK